MTMYDAMALTEDAKVLFAVLGGVAALFVVALIVGRDE
jgi:hypothetical protein